MSDKPKPQPAAPTPRPFEPPPLDYDKRGIIDSTRSPDPSRDG
jgi:hypothetical protein